MILTTTGMIEGRPVRQYLGIVTGEAIAGVDLFKDLSAALRDVVGGRSGAYENILREARVQAFSEIEAEAREKGADAVIGIDIDYQVVGKRGSMLMVTVSGTAVKIG